MQETRGKIRPVFAAVAACALLVLSACAATDVPSRWAQTPENQRAIVFGTITAEMGDPGPLSRYLILFRNVETKEVAHLSIYPGMDIANDGDPELYERKRSIGKFFEIVLPAGRYEFFDFWMVAIGLGGATTEYRPKEPFSIPFTIEAGTVNYIGEFRTYPMVGRGIFGGLARSGGYFVVRDQEARDTRMFLKRRGAVITEPIRKIALDLETNGSPLVWRSPLFPF